MYDIKSFDQNGRLPNVPANVKLVDGFIEDTLPKFISENSIGSISFIHIDADTYSPAKVILLELKSFMRAGTIILFDQLCGYPNWRSHEYRALTEVFDDSEYEFLGFASNKNPALYIRAAIRIL